MRGRLVVVVACVMALSWARPVCAQSANARQVHRFEVSLGGLWLSGADMGGKVAQLRANRVPPAPFTVFNTSTREEAAPGFDGRIGFWLTRAILVEGGFVYARPPLETRISGDIEGAPALTAAEDIDQYFIDANVVWMIDRFTLWRRIVPFVSGGGGYLRQLHEGRTLVETGQVYHVGGGVRQWLHVADRGWIRGLGVQLEARAYVLAEGVQLADDRPRTHGAFSGAFFVTF
jgi:hypothetical protein